MQHVIPAVASIQAARSGFSAAIDSAAAVHVRKPSSSEPASISIAPSKPPSSADSATSSVSGSAERASSTARITSPPMSRS